MSWAEGIEDAVSMDATKAMRANAPAGLERMPP